MTILKTIKSVVAAFIGVQSDKNRVQDFSNGKASHFIIVGVIAVIAFIISLMLIVSAVIPNS
jgi:hypothetical protein